MIGTLYDNIKSASAWTKEYIDRNVVKPIFNEKFKRVILNIITIGAYEYHYMNKQYKIQDENYSIKVRQFEENRRRDEENRRKDIELEYLRLLEDIKKFGK